MLVPLSKIYNLSRDLAKTSYYQTLFSCAKEMNFKVFENNSDLTDLQIVFLNYLGFYNMLNIDIATGDIDVIVKSDKIYEDAWSLYKQRKRNSREIDNLKKNTSLDTPDDIVNDKIKKTTTKFVFRRK